MPEPANRVPLPNVRPSAGLSPRPSFEDESWTVFGLLTVVAFLLGAAFCVWKAFPGLSGSPAPVSASTLSAPAAVRPAPSPTMPSAQVADQPLSWRDLTLMLRAGMRDDEIIAAINEGRQLVFTVGAAEATTLRQMGAGSRLLEYLRTSPVYATPSTSQPLAVAARVPVTTQTTLRPPVLPRAANLPPPVSAPTPVDYAAKDRQIKDLQSQIDRLDEQILRVRSQPQGYGYPGNYNGNGYRYGEESPLKKYLDQLDNQRNDLRRQKWRLEGR